MSKRTLNVSEVLTWNSLLNSAGQGSSSLDQRVTATLKVVTNEKGEDVGEVLTIIC
jgi:hypothetical protein